MPIEITDTTDRTALLARVDYSADWVEELHRVLHEIAGARGFRPIILEFAGEQKFAAAGPAAGLNDLIESHPRPLILTIREEARGALAGILAAAHLCVAADRARFFGPDSHRATTADRALAAGLINRAVPKDSVDEAAARLARRISGLAPLAVRTGLRAVNRGLRLSRADGLRLETELFSGLFATADMREGTRAFLEKRRPRFGGK